MRGRIKEPKKSAPKEMMNAMDALLPSCGLKARKRMIRSGDATVMPMLIWGIPYSPLGRYLSPAKNGRYRSDYLHLLRLASWRIPIWAFALRADSWLLLYVSRNPFMPASLTLKTFSSNLNNRHTHLHLHILFISIYLKNILVKGLTSYYFYGNILIEYILWRVEMEFWKERGLAIAESNTVKKNRLGWQVPSQSGNGTYIVNMDSREPFCTCQHFETTHEKCQHIYAVEFITQREVKPDGTITYTKSIRVSYNQEWHSYNEAQTHEQGHFVALLKDLCDGIEQPEYKFGRPRLPLADVVFGLVYKSYSTMSGRRFTTQLKEAQEAGLISKASHYNSAFRYLENPELTPLLKTLIEQSACPLKAVETDFAVDSSGFATKTYSRWYDHKYGVRTKQKWVKTHLMCGVRTHIVTSVEATPYESADIVQLIPLLNKTAETFPINEVSADRAYSSRKNLHAIQAIGGTAYIPFKNNARGMGSPTTGFDGLWFKMWHYFNFNREAFLQHYHKRSNVESAFSMIKSKFGGSVRAKTPTAQVNEVLCKILCHNICVLIQSMYELGIEPIFSGMNQESAL